MIQRSGCVDPINVAQNGHQDHDNDNQNGAGALRETHDLNMKMLPIKSLACVWSTGYFLFPQGKKRCVI